VPSCAVACTCATIAWNTGVQDVHFGDARIGHIDADDHVRNGHTSWGAAPRRMHA